MTALGHSAFLQALGWAVLNSLWQMALLWVAFNSIISLSPAMRPALKSKWATSLLLTGFAWFIFTFISLLFSKEETQSLVALQALPAETNKSLNQWLNSTLPLASLFYILLLALPVWRFIRNYRYVQVLRKYNLSKIHVDWRIYVKRIAAQIGITRPVHIWVSDLISSPVTIGYLKPIILVPLAAVSNLTPQQMEAVLLHELAHIRRYDYLINLLINGIQTVLYFNPFVKAFVKTVERERERSCDEMVIQFQYDPHNYASALLMLERNSHTTQQMALAAAGKNDLLNRIERILKIEKKPVLTFNKMAGLVAGVLCVILLNALIIVSKPFSGNEDFAFERIGSPAFIFSDENEIATPLPDIAAGNNPENESDRPAIENHAASTADPELTDTPPPDADPENENESPEDSNYDWFKTVNTIAPVVPELTDEEQQQVAGAVEATKKVMKTAQWKQVEKSIADALTQMEKEHIKEKYMEELEKIDWDKLEEKLKIAYDDINWEKINAQLNSAITEIKLDSLEMVYNIAIEEFEKTEKLATCNDDTVNVVVPMPDVSVECIKQGRKTAKENLERIKSFRSRKIIHL